MSAPQTTAHQASLHENNGSDRIRQRLDNELLNTTSCVDDNSDIDPDSWRGQSVNGVSFSEEYASHDSETESLATSDVSSEKPPSLRLDVDSASDLGSEAESSDHESLVSFSDGTQFDPTAEFPEYAVDPNRHRALNDYNLTIQDICSDRDYSRGGQNTALDMWLNDETECRNDWIKCGGTDLREGVKLRYA